jgi:hypothetical protein
MKMFFHLLDVQAVTFRTALTFLLVVTCAPSAQVDRANDNGQALTGSWLGTAVATSLPLPPSPELKSLITFARDGGATETHRLFIPDSPLGPLLTTPGHGEWVRTGDNQFALTLISIYEGGPNSPLAGQVVALEKIRFRLRIDPRTGHLTGNLVDELRDLNGSILFTGTGTFDATRIPVEPLP